MRLQKILYTMQRAKVHRKAADTWLVCVRPAAKYRNVRQSNVCGSYSIQIGRTVSFPTPTALVPHFLAFSLSSFLPLRSFHFLLSFWPKTDSGHGGSGATAARPFCMPRVPCHTRQQARKSNFHRETYYTPPSRVYRASSEAYTVQGEEGGRALSRGHRFEKREKSVASGNFAAHCDWRLDKRRRHTHPFIVLTISREISLIVVKYDCCSLASNRCSFE